MKKLVKQPAKEIQLENKFISLADQAERYVLKRIQVICKHYKWTYQGSFGYNIYTDGLNGDQEVFDTEIDRLIKWYGKRFGNLGLYVCVEGEFIECETALLKIGKPF